jgi:hypothetical protein
MPGRAAQGVGVLVVYNTVQRSEIHGAVTVQLHFGDVSAW